MTEVVNLGHFFDGNRPAAHGLILRVIVCCRLLQTVTKGGKQSRWGNFRSQQVQDHFEFYAGFALKA